MTITVRSRLCERRGEAARDSSFKLVLMSVRDAFNAGAMPHNTAHRSETATANNATFQSMRNGTALIASLKFNLGPRRSVPP